ncbi:MAG: Gfo/Idh/MocA family oxidoreductase [Kiritimatiellae bacterium]|nr:Gfo/Idh/MocA family oxidoreductase [Kiritimatiellia bacterium]
MKKMGDAGRTVRLGVIGLGGRGLGQMQTVMEMPDVRIAAVCDVHADRTERARQTVREKLGYVPDGVQDYRELNARDDIEAVIVMTSWTTHALVAVDAMRAGKRVAMEVGGAASVEECWQLVHASETTGQPCMMLENCCYGLEEMTLLNMVKQGLFGELVHCAGGYMHDLRAEIGMGDTNRHYRQLNFLCRNGDLYPTHELGPIAKYLNLNRGNRMLSLVSMASKAAGLNAWLREHRPDHPLAGARINQGDIVNTIIKCANGETILLTHDCTLPRPYSRGGRIQGTRGIWMEDNRSIYLERLSPTDPSAWTHTWESDKAYMEKYKHPLWQAYEEFGLRGGHGGMDYLVLRAFVESVQEKKNPPIDVYDTAAWMAITCLSEQSVAMGGMPVPVPDFTNGAWIHRGPPDHGTYSLD